MIKYPKDQNSSVIVGRKAQSSIEYMFIVGIALMIIIPGTALFFQYSQDSQDNLLHSKVYKIGSELVSTGEMIYSVGENSWQTVEVSMPETIKRMTVYSNTGDGIGELIIRYGHTNPSDAVFFTSNTLLNSTGNSSECETGCLVPISNGVNRIRIESGTEGEIRYRILK
ncbi:MAG: hypothetical protein ACOCU6_00700 [Nanoarchaeota archaeon]